MSRSIYVRDSRWQRKIDCVAEIQFLRLMMHQKLNAYFKFSLYCTEIWPLTFHVISRKIKLPFYATQVAGRTPERITIGQSSSVQVSELPQL